MDGRDFGPPRSVHGPPPPLLSGLAMDSHRVGAATAGRLPASGLPGPLPPGKYMAGLNLHPHPGKCPALCPPPLAPSGSWGEARGIYAVCPSLPTPEFSTGVRRLPLSWRVHGVQAGAGPRRAGGETPGPRAEASLEASGERGARRSCLPPARRALRKSEPAEVIPNSRPFGWSLGWSFQNLSERRTSQLHTL